MEILQVIQGPVTLPAGLLVKLSDDQAKPRLATLKKHKQDFYEVMAPVQFKTGEVLTFRELPPKALLSAFLTPEQIQTLIHGHQKTKTPDHTTGD